MRTEEGKLIRIEQQRVSKHYTIDGLIGQLESKPSWVRGIYRIDNARFNPDYVGICTKA